MNKSSWSSMLKARALQNDAARLEQSGGETISVWVPQKRRLPPPLCWLVRFRKERVARLDRIGSYIWNLCDGKRNVENIVEEIAGQYRLTFHESRVAVTGYLKTLIQRGVLAVELAETESE